MINMILVHLHGLILKESLILLILQMIGCLQSSKIGLHKINITHTFVFLMLIQWVKTNFMNIQLIRKIKLIFQAIFKHLRLIFSKDIMKKINFKIKIIKNSKIISEKKSILLTKAYQECLLDLLIGLIIQQINIMLNFLWVNS